MNSIQRNNMEIVSKEKVSPICSHKMQRLFALLLIMLAFLISSNVQAQIENTLITINQFDAAPEINYVNTETFELSGTRKTSAAIFINGELRIPEGEGNWSLTFSPGEDGLNEFSILAVGAADPNATALQVNVLRDVTPPEINLVNLEPFKVFTEPVSQIELDVVEEGSGLDFSSSISRFELIGADERLFCAGIDSSQDCWFSTNADQSKVFVNFQEPLSDGQYSINRHNSYISDVVRNRYTFATIDFNVNTTGTIPVGTVSVLPLAPEVYYNSRDWFTLQGERFPQTAVHLNGEEIVPIGSGNWSYTIQDLSEGEHEWVVDWVDASGQRSEALSFDVFVDTIRPEVSLVNLESFKVFTEPVSQIELDVVEEGSGLDFSSFSSRFYLDGEGGRLSCLDTDSSQDCWFSTNADQSKVFINFQEPLSDGEYSINRFNSNSYISDVARNRYTFADIEFNVNTTGTIPVGTVRTIPLAPEVYFNSRDWFTLQGERFPQTAVHLNGEEIVPIGSGNWSYTIRDLPEGELQNWTIDWVDASGQRSEAFDYHFFVDLITPTLDGLSPADGGEYPSLERIIILTSSTDIDSPVSLNNTFVNVYKDDVFLFTCQNTVSTDCTITQAANGAQLNFPFILGRGRYDLDIRRFADKANNIVVDRDITDNRFRFTITGQIDTEPPARPSLGEFDRITDKAVVTLSGNKAPFSFIVINGKQIDEGFVGENWSSQVQLNPGVNDIEIRARDFSENESDAVLAQVTFNDAPPQAVGFTAQTNPDGTSIAIDWASFDEFANGADIASYYVYLSEQAFVNVADAILTESITNGSKRTVLTGLEIENTYYITVLAEDRAGNLSNGYTVQDIQTFDTSRPYNAQQLSAEITAPNAATVSWIAPQFNVDSVQAYRIELDGVLLTEVNSATLSYDLTGLTENTTYQVKLTSVDNANNVSDGVSLGVSTAYDNPSSISINPKSFSLDLTWQAPAQTDGIAAYNVYVSANDFTSVSGMTPSVVVNSGQFNTTVAGLSNDINYFIAVTSVNKNGYETVEVQTVNASPGIDDLGPEVTATTYNNQAFTDGAEFAVDGEFCVALSDDNTISRVEFSLDGGSVVVDVTSADGYCLPLQIQALSDGDHQLQIQAFDIFENTTTIDYAFTSQIAVPVAPNIVQPTENIVTNEQRVLVQASSTPGFEVQFQVGEEVGDWQIVNATGQFERSIVLSEGANTISVRARNRAGEGEFSDALIVTLDQSLPTQPIGLVARPQDDGQINLTWTIDTTANYEGFNIYRSQQAFSEQNTGTRVNQGLITNAAYEDVLLEDGMYYYRVSSENDLGTESLPSLPAQVVADSTGPVAESIVYSTEGSFDAASQTYGRGELSVLLTVNEPLITTPFLSISPDGGVPISVALDEVIGQENQYQGSITLDETTQPGIAYAVFSARDKFGNRGTEVLAGQQIVIDTQGPLITSLATTPETPILTDALNPVDVTVTFELNESLPSGEQPSLEYRLSSSNPEYVLMTNLSNISANNWQGVISLPSNAGELRPENLEFRFSATDALGNTGNRIEGSFITQVYQGELPPLAVPFNFRGQALSQGQIQLDWFSVENAVAYQLYRKAPGETELTLYQRLTSGDQGSASFVDQTAVDGEYEYQIASIRQENGQEALSVRSEIVAVTSDSQAPETPTNFTLELFPIGIQTTWSPVIGDDIRYRLYRAENGPITSTEGLTPLFDQLVEPMIVDTNAVQSQPAYIVVAVDSLGNESAPSETAYLNVDLLPVSQIKVRLEEAGVPELQWQHSRSSINQFDIFLGQDESGVKLNNTPLSQTNYQDVGYANNQRDYAIVAIDENVQRSLPRTITLPQIELSIVPNQDIKRNVINALAIDVKNLSEHDINNARIKVISEQGTFQSQVMTLSAKQSSTVAITVAGLPSLPDNWAFSLEMHSEPNDGEIIEIATSEQLSVQEGALGLSLQTQDFVRGAQGTVNFSLENTGASAIQLITANNFGKRDAPGVVYTLTDQDDNILAVAPFRQSLGQNVLNTASGESIANIAAGQVWESDAALLTVPENAPDEVFITLQINDLYANRGTTEEVQVSGPVFRQRVVLSQTPYKGVVDSVTPTSSFGNEPIVITGQAIDNQTGQPVAGVDLNVVITNAGFERSFEVITDETGAYEHTFQPQKGESGRYKISVLHPIQTIRPQTAEFVISRLSISPSALDLRIPYLLNYDLPLSFSAGDGTELTNLRFELRAEDQPNGIVPTGIDFTFPEISSLSSGDNLRETIVIRGEESAIETGQFFIAVFADQSPAEPIGMIDVIYEFLEARPALQFSPAITELGSTLDGNALSTITLENSGLVALQDVNVSLVTTDGFPAFDWIRLVTPQDLGNIDVGEKRTVDIILQPNNAAPIGTERFFLLVQSTNAPARQIPIITSVSESGEGGVLLKVTDMYSGTLDGLGRTIQGLEGATVTVQSETLADARFTYATDALGEVFIEELPAGRYSIYVSAQNYQEELVRIRVQPGLVQSEQVFMDFNLIRLEWSVEEVTIQDRYEIVLSATFETDVPAAVVMLEPTSIELPEMEVGDVFYGELRMTNYGLIRAFDINFEPQESDEFFQFDYLLDVVPEFLEAKQSVVIPYKVTALKSLEQQDATGGGCGVYTKCSACSASSNCPTGVSETHTNSCVTRSYGSCAGGGSGGAGNLRRPGIGGGDFGTGIGGPELPGIRLSSGMPECRAGGDGCTGAN